MRWTDDQKKVIGARGTNLLVSAAAGSGKTTVLTERILSLLTDSSRPCDIDRLLIVTFTRVAAAEMKTKIEKKLRERAAENPDDAHLRDQLIYVHRAQITTIDGFCRSVVQSYGYLLGLPASFRVADEDEMKILRKDVLTELLESSYAAEEKDFVDFMEQTATGKGDEPVRDAILSLYDTVMSAPDPEGSLRALEEEVRLDKEDPGNAPWLQETLSEARVLCEDGAALARSNLEYCRERPAISDYVSAAESDLEYFLALTDCESYADYYTFLTENDAARLNSLKTKGDPLAARQAETYKDLRKRLAEIRATLKDSLCPAPPERLAADAEKSGGRILSLIRLVRAFRELFTAKKQSLRKMDFQDIEQFACTLLIGPDGERTDTAREIASRFDHVFIDEYQDSSDLQEAILSSVSRAADGENNYFMVGDVKQSIYSFRQARPDLFIGKYKAFGNGDGGERIDLHSNFRSRREIIGAVNAVFSRIMRPEIGGIAYDEDAALAFGADYPDEVPEGTDPAVECLLLAEDEGGAAGADDMRVFEARMIGERIRRMVGREMIWDRDAGSFRPVQYRDVVILLRSGVLWAEAFSRTLGDMDIPVFAQERTGYFSAPEIVTILDLLRILDNMRQDIPLAGVLHSPIGGLTAEELACLRIEGPKGADLRDCLVYGEENVSSPALREKLSAFLDLYYSLREKAGRVPIHLLLHEILGRTGYLTYEAGLPGGDQRIRNLRMLVSKAKDFEKTQETSLPAFVRYIDSLKKYEIDFGAASAFGSGDDVVRISTIHKSKGLEYPVVFVAGISRSMKYSGGNGGVRIHPRCGIGAIVVDPEERTKRDTVKANWIARRLADDSLGEELRILYVAMTRAMQKLILTGAGAELLEKADPAASSGSGVPLPVSVIRGAGSFLTLLSCVFVSDPGLFKIVTVSPSALPSPEERRGTASALPAAALLLAEEDPSSVPAGKLDPLRERFSHIYPYAGRETIPVKVSVSEIKAMHYEDEDAVPLRDAPPVVPYIPAFVREEEPEEMTGAARGTIYHAFMEHLDYGRLPENVPAEPEDAGETYPAALRDFVRAEISRLSEEGCFRPEDAAVIRPADIVRFLRTPLGKRMRLAALEGRLRRETPFTYSVPAESIDPAWPGDETILVQGITDAFFEDGDGLVLVDYKTDAVISGSEKELLEKYLAQLLSYSDALSRLTGIPVREAWIYSFSLGREISVPLP